MLPKEISIKFRFWINLKGEKLLGKGRVELLELIEKHGSILKASQEMKMSYRQAWQMVKEMNERVETPLVEKFMGGKSGGGARLTQAGKEAVKQYHEFEERISQMIEKELETFKNHSD